MQAHNVNTEETKETSPGIFETMKKNKEGGRKRVIIILLIVGGVILISLLGYFGRHFIAEHALGIAITIVCLTGLCIAGYYLFSKKGSRSNKKATGWKLAIGTTVVVLLIGFGVYWLYTNQSPNTQQAAGQGGNSVLDTLKNLKQSKLDTAVKLGILAETYRRAIDSINGIKELQQEYVTVDQLVQSRVIAANAANEEFQRLQSRSRVITFDVSLQGNQKQVTVSRGGASVMLKRE